MKNIRKYLSKKQYIMFILSLIIIILSSFSYAFYYSVDMTDEHVATTDCFKLSFTDQNDINLAAAYPLSDSEGSLLTPYEFTLKNNCKRAGNYEVNIEMLNETTLNTNYIKYKLNNSTPDVLGNQLEKNEYVNQNIKESRNIDVGIILPDEEKTYNLRLWIDENSTPETTANKIFMGKVVIKTIDNKEPYQTIILNTNGGLIEHDEIIRVKTRVIGNMETPIRTGYTFDGWYSDQELTNKITEDSIVTNSLTNIYAKWAANKYNITFNSNDGEEPSIDSKEVTYDQNYSDLASTSRLGYTFKGWYTSPSGGEKIESTSIVKITQDTMLYAQWEIITYTISYTLNSGSLASGVTNPTTYTVESPTITLNNPIRTGYTFSGWSGSASGTSVTIPKGSTGNKSYTATWSVINYTITYNYNGGSASNPLTYNIETPTFSLSNPTRTGYTFKSWSGSASGTSISIPKGSTGNKSYTASWTANTYTITYNYNGKKNYITGSTATKSSFSGAENECFGSWTITMSGLAKNDKVRLEYDYKGTNLKANSGGRFRFQNKGAVNGWNHELGSRKAITPTGTTGTVHVVAMEITLTKEDIAEGTYSANMRSDYYASGSITVSNVKLTRVNTLTYTKTYGTTLGTLPSISESGYTFAGWYTAASGGSKISSSTAVPAANTTYYAHWS